MLYRLFWIAFLLAGCLSAPVRDNSFREWYGKNGERESITYRNFAMSFLSVPAGAEILWDERSIGKTPLIYRFSGTLKNQDSILVKALPTQPGQCVQAEVLGLGDPLPRELSFDMSRCHPVPKVDVEFSN